MFESPLFGFLTKKDNGGFKKIRRRIYLLILVCLVFYLVPFGAFYLSTYPYFIVHFESKERRIEFTKDKPKNWVDLKQMGRFIPAAVITSEDANFYNHPGFEIEAIKKAAKLAWETKLYKKGGSTITQQLAKNLFFDLRKTIIRKIRELQVAVALEKFWGKQKILEAYLNVIEFGPGVYGIAQATQYYFKKRPSQLTPREAAFLAMVLPNPTKYSASFRKGELSPFAQKRIAQILKFMEKTNYISTVERNDPGSGFLKVPDVNPTKNESLDIAEHENLNESGEVLLDPLTEEESLEWDSEVFEDEYEVSD